MAGFFLDEKLLPDILAALATEGEIIGPAVTDDGVVSFAPVRSPGDLFLDACRTLIPPKKFLLPPRELLLDYNPAAGYRAAHCAPPEIVLAALHPCDLHAISFLDRLFLDDIPDTLYRLRRDNLFLVGLSCDPDGYCFCDKVGCRSPGPFDIFLQRAPGGFFVLHGSGKGERFLGQVRELLTEDVAPFEPVAFAASPAAVADEVPESPLWEEFGRRCLSCGACSACCPTCACFDVREYGALDGETAHRVREWDNCLFADHGAVAGGGNFRPSRVERLRYRYRHKYGGFGPLRGVVSCVGCGRCRAVCPVGIDLQEIVSSRGEET